MTRRSAAHDYTRPGIYHITMHVADGLGPVLGTVVGSLSAPDGSADAPRTALSPIGQMVQHELLHSIHAHYPMVFVQDYVVMPDHLHCIVVVQDLILSTTGRRQTLGQVIAGFKKGCNRRYWDLTGQAISNTPAGSTPAGSGGTAAHSVSSGSLAGSLAGQGCHPCIGPHLAQRARDHHRMRESRLPRGHHSRQRLCRPLPPLSRPPRPLCRGAVCSSSPPGSITTAPKQKPSPWHNARP